MDRTYDSYTNEDEANRELTTCLNLLGHAAKYHYPLNNGRTADVLVDNYAILEGKLDPNTSDIDRLIGQLEDYAAYHYKVYVVVYGYIVPTFVERIQRQIIPRFYNKVGLIYLENPQRTRGNKLLLEQRK
jgi:hypothetical protein